MTHKSIHYTHHAVQEMRKARIQRRTVRTVLAKGERRVEGQRGEDIYYVKVLATGPKTYEVVYLENAQRVLVITAYILGEYD